MVAIERKTAQIELRARQHMHILYPGIMPLKKINCRQALHAMLTYKAALVRNFIPVVTYDNGGNNSSPGLAVAEGPRVVKDDKVGRPEQGLS